MNRADAIARLKQATADLTNARHGLAQQVALQRQGMAHSVDFATHVEHSAFTRWMRASAAFTHSR
ncbi:hypothetical protein [Afipia sp. DC4300-2b1]|uniref:hypothetical protein n=1 Tax=Afipia sp. DC4300-2b1 TaxID=2804672 RepID=UPI003CF91E50